MDPRLGTRGSNDLGGAMFKGEHVRVLLFKLLSSNISHSNGSPAFLIRQKGEKESKSEDQAQEQAKDFTKFTRQGQDASYTKGALVFATFVSLFAFGFYLSSSKRGRLLRQHDQDLLMF